MTRIILTFGILSGAIVIVNAIIGLSFADESTSMQFLEWMGYLFMLVALSVIFIGIKRYRDQELGGVITFGSAFLVGLGIAAVAGVVYVVVWEVYLAQTDYRFIEDYIASVLATKEAAGIPAAEMQKAIEEMNVMREQYGNPLFRLPMTFIEIFPVGLLISLISAALLRRPSFHACTDSNSDGVFCI